MFLERGESTMDARVLFPERREKVLCMILLMVIDLLRNKWKGENEMETNGKNERTQYNGKVKNDLLGDIEVEARRRLLPWLSVPLERFKPKR